MKRAILLFAAALALLSFASAQTIVGTSLTDHYSVLSELGQDRSDMLSRQLEGYYGLYNQLFRFSEDDLGARLNVREFETKEGFDKYLGQVVGQTKDDFVYLHYPNPERSELLVFAKDEPDFSASLAHQAFVQFLKAFVPNPPLWMREGLAVVFETATWDDSYGQVDFPENLAWLETVKSLKERSLFISLDSLLSIGQDQAREELDVFYPQAWAFVSFLLNTGDKEYNRFLWDAMSALERDASLGENQGAVLGLLESWYGLSESEEAFLSYLDGRKTFPELVAAGVRSYAEKSWEAAVDSFTLAGDMNEASYVPQYYLGLIAYAQNEFALAEYRYKAALELGCDPAITNYALGVNAYAQNRLEDAMDYLAEAKESAPDRYGAKVDELVAKFPPQ